MVSLSAVTRIRSALFGPQKQVGIFHAERQIRRVSDADSIDRMATPGVVILNRPPEPSSLVFVQQKSDRHWSGRPRSTHLLQFPAQAHRRRTRRDAGLEAFERRSFLRDVGIHLGLILSIEFENMPYQGQRDRRKLLVQHLGRVPLLKKGDDIVQADTVPRQADLAVGVIDQKFRQIHVRHSREAGTIPELSIIDEKGRC